MAEPAATETELPKGAFARLGELAWQALPAIAGAVGVLGFVALVGGAIQWVRFWAAGLPADQAVRVMPEAELVTIGAVSLVAFAVLGLLAVLLLYVIDSDGSASVATLRGLFVLAGVETAVALVSADLPAEEYAVLVPALAIAGWLAYVALADLPKRIRDRDNRKLADDALRTALETFRAAQDRYDDAVFQLQGSTPDRALVTLLRQASIGLRRARRGWHRALDAWVSAGPAEERGHRESVTAPFRDPPPTAGTPPPAPIRPPDAAELGRAIALEPSAAAKKPDPGAATGSDAERGVLDVVREFRVHMALAAVALLVAAMAVLVFAGPDSQDEEERLFAAGLFVVIVLGAANFGLARATRRFAWYGVGALLSLILFGAVMNIGRTLLDPQVQPLALVRTGDDSALCGVYVTETDKRVYMGRVVDDEGKSERESEIGADLGAGRMFWVPSGQVDVVSVGPLQEIDSAEVRARLLANEVLNDRADRPATQAKPTKRTPASRKPGDDFTACATTELDEGRVDRLKPAARRNAARHRAR